MDVRLEAGGVLLGLLPFALPFALAYFLFGELGLAVLLGLGVVLVTIPLIR